jgi:lipopolysaccharide/colanic/teichoic acid biosynthesis glycosyltransferase
MAVLPEAVFHRETNVVRLSDELYHFYKRSIDVTIASVMLILLAPLLVLIAVLIRIDSPGPVLFVQERVGAKRRRHGGRMVWTRQNFAVYKFRSMTHAADEAPHIAHIKAFVEGTVEGAANGAAFKLANDRRVTRVGNVLRRTSLDELPQLLNVLLGEMSLVGPRPSPTYEFSEYEEWHRERLAAVPGLTGLWQVSGRCDVSFEEMIRMDLEYVRNRSVWLDVKILAQTIPAVISGRGAA